MRKFLLTILAAGSLAAANAQSAGSILVYGNVGFNTGKDSAKTTNTNFNINPGVGYSLNNNWVIGLQGGFGMSTMKEDAGGKMTDNSFSIGAFGRYTKHLGNIFSVYAQLNAGYMGSHSKTEYSGVTIDDVKYSGFGANLFPAVQVAVGNWFNMDFSFGGLGYSTMKANTSGANASSSFAFTFGQTANIGISKYFGCGHHMHGHHEPGEDTRHMDTSDDDDDAPKAHNHHDKKAKKSKKDKDSDDE
ncbi:MAG: porin family protein [Bacteroidetes bacterium]|nr:porin family protein [Bacteroidota bacterium]